MAEYVIPPKMAIVIVKCSECGALYVPDRSKDRKWNNYKFDSFEECPVCGYDNNKFRDTIPLWEYNLIKFFRGGFHGDT